MSEKFDQMTKTQLEKCKLITNNIIKNVFSKYFQGQDQIKIPIDLTKIKHKLETGNYPNYEMWAQDMRYVFENDQIKNSGNTFLIETAVYLKKKFEKQYTMLKCLNSRNFEYQILLVSKKIQDLLSHPPPELPMSNWSFPSININFLESNLSKLTSPEQQNELAQILQTNSMPILSSDFQINGNTKEVIDLSILDKKVLVDLNNLINKEITHNS